MNKSLNLFFVLRNRYFRRITVFNKKKVYQVLLLSILSTAIFTSFPLVTQVYIRYLYIQESLGFLMRITFFFLLLFIIKMFIDLVIEKYKVKYFLKVEKKVKELMINKYCSKLQKLAFEKSDLFSKHLHLYLLLVRTVHINILDIMKIIIASTIIFFFDKQLFLYFVYATPFFALFYLVSKRIELSKQDYGDSDNNSDFGLLIRDMIDKKSNPKIAKQIVMRHLETELKKKMLNKKRFVPLNVSMNSFINFFRLTYLAYFGYYIIVFNIKIEALIVGLLFITILIKPIISILRTRPLYNVCAKSFFKINSLYRI